LVELVAMKPQFYALLLVAVVAIGLALVAHTRLVVAVAVALILETMVQPMVRMVAKANMAASVEIMAVAVAALVGITFLAVAVEAVLLTQTTYMSLMGQQLLL
jgi:predicted PurR-regulated permease PerM